MQILRVNMNKLQYSLEDSVDPYKNLGGRGLTSKIISEEVSPKADPLDGENKLIFAPGILAATPVPNSGRLSVGAKSPLTNGIKEANSGGAAAQKLAKLGIQAIVVTGRAEVLNLLKIDKKGVTFFEADNLKGLGNYQVIEELKIKFGKDVAIISIGPAGEKKLRAASISVTTPDFHIRMAARGGLGAVMGSKNVKAIVIDDEGGDEVEAKDKTALRESAKELAQGITAHPMIGALGALGTPALVNMMNGFGCLATKNYSQGKFDNAEAISGEHLVDLMKLRPNSKAGHRCMNGCVIGCSNIFTDEGGELIVSGLEFETIALMGSNCMISDIDIVAQMNRVCNDLGLDTMDIGGAIGVAMEAGLVSWGDGKAALDLVQEIGKGSQTGTMIGNGCRYTGLKLGVRRVPTVKGQCLAGYDPRVLKGTGATYATSTMGADHTCGNAIPSPANPEYNPSAANGQGEVTRFLQTYHAAIDSLGLCLFASLPLLDAPDLQKSLVSCVSALRGEALEETYLMQLGGAVLQTEKRFNDCAGFTNQDDRLPEFFVKEALPETGNVFDVPEKDLDSVFQLNAL